MDTSVEVAVRVRPINQREKEEDHDHDSIISTNGKDVFIKNEADVRKFSFDYVYDSTKKQQDIYQDIGIKIIEHANTGYNSCIFAYGQTGCFAKETPIMLYNGRYKAVEDITKDDVIMGDDSTPRKVLKLFSGVQTMYDIYDADTNKLIYTVNEDHIMVFKKFQDHLEDEFLYRLHKSADTSWFDLLTDKVYEMPLTEYRKIKDYQRYVCIIGTVNFPTKIDDSIVNLIHDYDSLNNVIDKFMYVCNENQMTLLNRLARYSIPLNISHEMMAKLRFIASCCGKQIKFGHKLVINEAKLYFRPLVIVSKHQKFYGFMLNKNHRFIGAGFNVLRNSGKTYSMMGEEKEHMGLIPRICFTLIRSVKPNITYRIELSYLEIYYERIRDLLNPKPQDNDQDNPGLKMRIHPKYGIFVEELTQHAVSDYKEIKKFIDRGNKERAFASTLMNDRSSRSHAILTLYFTQIIKEQDTIKEITSKINLVDLAGSERVADSGVVGKNLKEAIHINKSLLNLSLVITALAKKNKNKEGSAEPIPFRNSVLTMLLKESLGGNSKTFMLATVSPAQCNYSETISTLRYANNAKGIINTIHINENSNDKMVRVLKEEIELLKSKLKNGTFNLSKSEIRSTEEEIAERERMMKEREKTWEEKAKESKKQLEEWYKKEIEARDGEVKLAHQNLVAVREQTSQMLKERDMKLEQEKSEFEKNRIVSAIKESHEYVEQQVQAQVREISDKYDSLYKKYITLEHLYNDLVVEKEELTKELELTKSTLESKEDQFKKQNQQLLNSNTVLNRQVLQLQAKIHSLTR